MNEAFIELYEGYLLKCEPHSTPDGRYLANLALSFAQRGGQNDVSITPDHSSFATAREAADCALAVGKRWVESNG